MWDEKKVRIIDIAEELGVSTATVSNVLHGKTAKISDRTVQRVQKTLQERGYIPNMAATLLAQNNSRIFGVIVNDHEKYEGHVLEDPFISEALNALSDEIEKSGYFLMLKKARKVMDIVRFASMWNMDGMVLIGFCADEYQSLRDHIRIPFVVYDGFFCNEGNICNLILDDFDGGKQVGQYLQKLGHRSVLCLADNELQPDYDRYLGLCAGMHLKPDFLIIPMHQKERGPFYQAHLSFLRQYTALFAVSDFYAVELMRFLMDHNIRIPEDMTVIGFDDSRLCMQIRPTLTSVRQDNNLRASLAIQSLLKMKESSDCSITEKLPVSLIIRESSAVPPAQPV